MAERELPGAPGSNPAPEPTQGLSFVRAEVRRQVELDVSKLWVAETSEDDTHPRPADRIQLIQRLKSERPPQSTGGESTSVGRHADTGDGLGEAGDVEHLFADPERVRAERGEHRQKELLDHQSAKRAYCENLIGQIDAYLAEHPGLTDPLVDRGNLRMELKDYQGAASDYTEAIRLDGPKKALCYYGRGLARSKLGDLSLAADDLRKAMVLDPSLEHEKADGRSELGAILLRLGDPAAAIVELDQALKGEPDRLGLYLRRGEAHLVAGNLDASEADFTRALELDPGCVEAISGREQVRAAMGRHSAEGANA
jgi:tetratricopeptide (TPR) repeat protein